MQRRSLLERLADQGEKELDKGTPAGIPAAGPVHVQAAAVLSDLVKMGNALSNGQTPAVLRSFMRMLDKAQPMMLEGLAGVPAEQIKTFMRDLRDRIDTILEVQE